MGFSGAALSQGIEEAAKLVQWAQYAIQQGASENEQAIRYNLDQFWKQKAALYNLESTEGRIQLDMLDARAHGVWDALESGKIFSASPSYAAFYAKQLTGGTPARPDAEAAAQRAKAAALGAAAAATRAYQPSVSAAFTRRAALTSSDLSQSTGLWKQDAKTLLGIPIWAWLVGGGIIVASFLLKD